MNVARRTKYRVSATVTFLTCPCHIPMLPFLLSGTAAGALLADNIWLVAAVVVPIFLYSAITAMLSFEFEGGDRRRPAYDGASPERSAMPGRAVSAARCGTA